MSETESTKQVLLSPVFENNPIALQILGVCSALAVTVQTLPSLYMTAGVVFVAAFSNLLISML